MSDFLNMLGMPEDAEDFGDPISEAPESHLVPTSSDHWELARVSNNMLASLVWDNSEENKKAVVNTLRSFPSIIRSCNDEISESQVAIQDRIKYLKQVLAKESAKLNKLDSVRGDFDNLAHQIISEIGTEHGKAGNKRIQIGGNTFTASKSQGSLVLDNLDGVPNEMWKLTEIKGATIIEGVAYNRTVDKVKYATHLRKTSEEDDGAAHLVRKKVVKAT